MTGEDCMRALSAATLWLAACLWPGITVAETYPSKPIRFVLPFGPGSASDTIARIAAQDLSQSLGQPVVVVGKPGADGALAAIEVQRAAPDGYTFLFGTNSPLSVVPNIRKEPPYNVVTDFTPVSYLGDNTFFIAVHPSLPVKSLAELIAHVKANPKKLNYATGNTYSIVTTAMLAQSNGLELEAIPYKSEPDAIADVLSGRVQILNGTFTSVGQHAQAGKLRVLATALAERSPAMPDVPSILEAGQPKFPVSAWFGLVGPAGVPPDIVARMNKEMVATLGKPQIREQMLKQGFVAKASSAEELARFMKDQLGVWKTALELAGIKPQ
jgi:tripartite-type tricarboxylate transporter receptor subunit TctC